MITAGTICRARDEKENYLVVVYRIDKKGNLFYDGLARTNGGAILHGHQSTAHFETVWEPVGQMRFEGAYKRYMEERQRTGRLKRHLTFMIESCKRVLS